MRRSFTLTAPPEWRAPLSASSERATPVALMGVEVRETVQ
ncbi:MAG: hypothetical protein OJF58_002271 [Enhydrobacter sp.]|nr:MAG: hypothetical protein OJF58_002271 [Enhydrobacter sp.]